MYKKQYRSPEFELTFMRFERVMYGTVHDSKPEDNGSFLDDDDTGD